LLIGRGSACRLSRHSLLVGRGSACRLSRHFLLDGRGSACRLSRHFLLVGTALAELNSDQLRQASRRKGLRASRSPRLRASDPFSDVSL